MRLFAVKSEGFVEYDERSFSETHLEKAIQHWMELNPQALADDGGLLILGKEVTTDLGAYIDLLGLDIEGNVAVVELKRDRTPRDTLAQALEYVAFADSLTANDLESLYRDYTGDEGQTLAEAHREFFNLVEDTAVAFGKDQRIVLVASDIVPAIRSTSEYLNRRGLRVTCLEFGYFGSETGEELLSTDIVVDQISSQSKRFNTAAGPRTDEETFIAACDDSGRTLFEPILSLGTQSGFAVVWGSRGFSLRVELPDGKQRTICIGHPTPQRPLQAKQSLLLVLAELARDLPEALEELQLLRIRCLDSGLFVPAGRGISVKYHIASASDGSHSAMVLDVLRQLAAIVRTHSASLGD